MREVTKTFKVYTFNSASDEIKDKIREHIDLDGFLYEWCMSERIKTLKALADVLDGTLDYSLSCVPSRGEYIKIVPKDGFIYNEGLDFDNLWETINQDKDCPLTGVCYDHDIIDHFTKYNLNEETLKDALNSYIKSIHNEYQHMLSDEYLEDFCSANEYEFTEDGKFYHGN